MNFRAILSLCTVSAALLACSCNTSSSGGTPGTKESFTITAPTLATTLKQGERQIIKLTLNRGSDFKQAVTIAAVEPKGLKVTIDHPRVAASEPAEFSIAVEAEKTAPLGDQVIKVTGTPESGTAASVDVKVKVNEGPKT